MELRHLEPLQEEDMVASQLMVKKVPRLRSAGSWAKAIIMRDIMILFATKCGYK